MHMRMHMHMHMTHAHAPELPSSRTSSALLVVSVMKRSSTLAPASSSSIERSRVASSVIDCESVPHAAGMGCEPWHMHVHRYMACAASSTASPCRMRQAWDVSHGICMCIATWHVHVHQTWDVSRTAGSRVCWQGIRRMGLEWVHARTGRVTGPMTMVSRASSFSTSSSASGATALSS